MKQQRIQSVPKGNAKLNKRRGLLPRGGGNFHHLICHTILALSHMFLPAGMPRAVERTYSDPQKVLKAHNATGWDIIKTNIWLPKILFF
jgi:hypothetical protein